MFVREDNMVSMSFSQMGSETHLWLMFILGGKVHTKGIPQGIGWYLSQKVLGFGVWFRVQRSRSSCLEVGDQEILGQLGYVVKPYL